MKKNTQHIVLVSIDTLRADCINSSPRAKQYLNKYKTDVTLKTDSLDKLLKSGFYFNNCISAAPYTSASHAAYFTGMWPLRNGVYEFFNRKLSKPTIFEYAKENDYTTIFQTDFPVILGPYLGLAKGVDNYFIEDEGKALKTLIKNREKKTLSFFHFGGVHYPYGFHTLKFGGKNYINKVNFLEKKYNLHRYKPTDVLDETFRNKRDMELLLRYKYVIENLYKDRRYDDLFNLYLEGINYFFQHRFNKFIADIKRFVDENNAILFVFSDHGEEWDINSEGHHNSISDGVLRVPLIVYGKQVRPGIEENIVRTIDIAPTILSLLPKSSKTEDMNGIKLDIFKSNKNTASAKYAISQVWTSIATKSEIANYQSKTILETGLTKPLKTYLSAEVIRTKNKKLSFRYGKDGVLTVEEFSVTGETNIRNDSFDLKKLLIKYNSSRKMKGKKVSVESKIRKELRSLGYQI